MTSGLIWVTLLRHHTFALYSPTEVAYDCYICLIVGGDSLFSVNAIPVIAIIRKKFHLFPLLYMQLPEPGLRVT